ncbi:hypothetical protein ABK040_009141 [Willaertia magna]
MSRSSEQLLAELMKDKKKNKLRLGGQVSPTSETGAGCWNSNRQANTTLAKDMKEIKSKYVIRYISNSAVDELELKLLLEEFKKVCGEDGTIQRKNFDVVIAKTLEKKFDQRLLPAFHRIFDAFDADKSGSIDFVELSTGISHLFFGDRKSLLNFIFSLIDLDNSGSVEPPELLEFFKKFFIGQAKMNGYKLSAERWSNLEKHLSSAFARMDLDGSGSIDYDEFIEAVNDPDSALGYAFLNL